MSQLTTEFNFEIGDEVYVRGSDHWGGQFPKRFVVHERIAVECHGGIQRFYRIGLLKDYVSETLLTRERPPYQTISDDELAEMERIGARSEAWFFRRGNVEE